jgi:N,N'-diacetylchitobiose transport system substrate-binding protein
MRCNTRQFALAVMLALLIAACGGAEEASTGAAGDEQSPAAAAAEEAGGDALSVWIMQPGSEDIETIVNETAAAFEEQNEGVTVDVQFVPWANAHDQFVTAIGGGQVPDVAEMGTTWTPEFAELGAFAPVDVSAGGDYVESLVTSATVDDETYGYPWYAGARSLIYRTDVFEDLGLEPPETWEDVLTAGDAIAESGDIDPIYVAGDDVHVQAPLVWQAGGELAVQEDTWTAQVDSEAGREAFAFYKELWDKGWSPEGAVNWNSVDVRDAFANGDSAMMIGGGWDLAAILSTNPDLEGNVGTALAPAGPGGNQDAFAGGSHLVTFAESENAELGAQFIEFMLQPEQVTAFTEAVGFLPGTVSGVEASSASGDELYGTFAEQLVEHSRSYPPTAAWGQIEGDQVFTNATQQMMQGALTADEAVAQINQQMQEAFDG